MEWTREIFRVFFFFPFFFHKRKKKKKTKQRFPRSKTEGKKEELLVSGLTMLQLAFILSLACYLCYG